MARKGQMEIMGLAIIMVLVMLGVLFVIRFVILRPDADIRGSYADTQLAANMLNAVLKTTAADCRHQSMTALFQDCARGPPGTITCPNQGSPTGSCDYLETTIEAIFGKTLDAWKKRYRFNACLYANRACVQEPIITFVKGDCSGARESKSTPIPTDQGTLLVRLDICK